MLCKIAMRKIWMEETSRIYDKNAPRKNVIREEIQRVIRHNDVHLETQNKV